MDILSALAFMAPLLVPLALCIVEAIRMYRERDQ